MLTCNVGKRTEAPIDSARVASPWITAKVTGALVSSIPFVVVTRTTSGSCKNKFTELLWPFPLTMLKFGSTPSKKSPVPILAPAEISDVLLAPSVAVAVMNPSVDGTAVTTEIRALPDPSVVRSVEPRNVRACGALLGEKSGEWKNSSRYTLLEALLKLPLTTTSLAPVMIALVRAGLFCRLFGPLSPSPRPHQNCIRRTVLAQRRCLGIADCARNVSATANSCAES